MEKAGGTSGKGRPEVTVAQTRQDFLLPGTWLNVMVVLLRERVRPQLVMHEGLLASGHCRRQKGQ